MNRIRTWFQKLWHWLLPPVICPICGAAGRLLNIECLGHGTYRFSYECHNDTPHHWATWTLL